MTISDKQVQLIDKFQSMADWETRYTAIIKMGKALPEMPEDYKSDDNLVKGCQSRVWIFAKLNDNGTVKFYGDSEAMIVRCLVAVLLEVYSGQSPDEILEHPPQFIKELGFEGNLSPSRANGLHSMVKQIQYFATAYKAMLQMQK